MDIKKLIAVATGEIHHINNGLCPDFQTSWDSRDSECPACKILIEAAAELEAELRDDHWPNGATVKLRWAGKHGWAKRDAEGHLISVCSGIRLNDTAWEVVQERKVQPARGG